MKFKEKDLRIVLVIFALCLVLETVVFNIRHFATVWGGEVTDVSSMYNSGVEVNPYTGNYTRNEDGSIVIENVNQKVKSIYIELEFLPNEYWGYRELKISYADEEHSNRTTRWYKIFKDAENSHYITLNTFGEVRTIRLLFETDTPFIVKNIILNEPVPFKFKLDRFLLYFTAISVGVLIVKYKILSSPLRKKNTMQRLIFGGVTLSFVVYLFFLTLYSAPLKTDGTFFDNFKNEYKNQYNKLVVDALREGQVHLLFDTDERLLELDNPYDSQERSAKGVDLGEKWDLAYYDGKFYSYFGIVQVLVTALPYNLLTDEYISTRLVVFIYAALSSVFLSLVWRTLAYKFMKKMSVGMFTLGHLTLLMCSMLTFMASRPYFYEVAGVSALFFSMFGLWMVLNYAVNRWNPVFLLLGCLNIALSVGCRPNFLFVSLLVPVILVEKFKQAWNENSKKRFAGLLAAVVIPYTAVGGALMWYNYIRFDSVFEFGSSYMLTVTNASAMSTLSPLSRLVLICSFMFAVLVPALNFNSGFPFITVENISFDSYTGYIYKEHVLGILTLPLMWVLAGIVHVYRYVRGHSDKRRLFIARLLIAFPLIVLSNIIVASFVGLATRYELDFMWAITLTALICGYFIYESVKRSYTGISYGYVSAKTTGLNVAKVFKNILCISMIVSIIMMFLLTFSSSDGGLFRYYNSLILYRIQQLLGLGTF